METYFSIEGHRDLLAGRGGPWMHEYADPATLDFTPYPAWDGDRRCIGTHLGEKSYYDHGYIWEMGMLIGKKLVSRTFRAPHDGMLAIRAIADIDMFSFHANKSSLRLMHNAETLWPTPGEYPDDFFPITYEYCACMPTFYVKVKAGDKLRFIGRNTSIEDRYDDVMWRVSLTYLPFAFLSDAYTVAPGSVLTLGTYNETGKTPTFRTGDANVATVDENGRLTTHGCGSTAVLAYAGEEFLGSAGIWVHEPGADPQNPLALSVYHGEPYSTPGGALDLLTDDTLQLAAEAGMVSCTHGLAPTSAVRFDNPSRLTNLLADGAFEETVDFRFLPAYRGGRRPTRLALFTATNSKQGKYLHIEAWYSKTSSPDEFIFLYAYESPGPLAAGTHFSLELSGFDGRVTDLDTLRIRFRRMQDCEVVLEEVDLSLADDGEEIAALRREKQERIWLPTIFSDGMMLARDLPVRVWGYGGKDGERVAITLTHADGERLERSAPVENGKWIAEFPPHPADDRGSEMAVTYRDQNFTFRDIWYGELIWAGGQSNMEVPVSLLPADEQEKYRAAFVSSPRIRWYRQSQCAAEKPRLDTYRGSWAHPSAANVGSFSAVGMSYILEMERMLGVPVGIVYGAVGATMLEAWLPESYFDEGTEYGKRILAKFRPRVTAGELWTRPCGPFHQMVHPLTDFAIHGVIWYQGESNSRDVRDYPYYGERLYALLNYWRERFRNPKLFLATVQLAPCVLGYGQDYGWCCIREEFLNLSLAHPHEMPTAVITDTADETHDIHPPNKLTVGRRLAASVADAVYGIPGIARGPVPTKMTVENGAARISFAEIGDGLASLDGEALRGFVISEDGESFVPAIATIEGDTLRVSADGAETPFEIRFAFVSCPNVNFGNKNGFPGTPFRIRESGLLCERERAGLGEGIL